MPVNNEERQIQEALDRQHRELRQLRGLAEEEMRANRPVNSILSNAISNTCRQISELEARLTTVRTPPRLSRDLNAEMRQLEEGEFRCADCESVVNRQRDNFYVNRHGHEVCESCYDDHYRNCADCGEQMNTNDDETFATYDDREICSRCADSCRSCEDCGSLYSADDGDDYCPNHREPTSEPRFRHYEENPAYVGEPYDCKTLASSRKFGIELEVGFKDPDKGGLCSHAVAREIGIAHDGSISGVNMGYELQFPPMAGNPAEKLITETCDKLKAHDVRINKSMGFHVHIDVNDLDELSPDYQLMTMRNLWLLYIAFEDVLLSFLPPSRRTSRYCRSLRSDYHFKEIREVQNMEQLERIWYRVTNRENLNQAKSEKKHETRYRGINMHTLISMRHLEIRYHSGTANARKILEWCNLHTKIVDCAFHKRIEMETIHALNNSIDINEKTNAFFSLLNLSTKSEAYFRTRQLLFQRSKPEKIDRKEKKIISDLLMHEEVEA